ncbi:GspB domain-containing protein [Pseudoduganella sp. FT93W]|uniref:GspB domain-containing protein n=1 Tax=Duganella fentianensis TaxID=2692177 RepID=A0A845I577_9BURK|nr:general secretion pathway protein GspB [Duganella fentianensis]MYN47255.1 GspB domain-containing protein [Duganella fentianensis]
MSYILEALKKAQAERQLGSAPTLHGASMQAPSLAAALPWWRRPLALAALLMAVVIVALLVLLLRPAPGSTPAVLTAAAPPVPRPAATGAPPGLKQELNLRVAVPPVAMPEPLPAPVAHGGVAARTTGNAASAAPAAATAAPAGAAGGAATPAPVAAAKPAATVRASEEPVLNLRELPEPIQRAIPAVAVGGYIYSPNPAERLLLIDKVLRHEGEEVAPGLVLEKLQPREAVFSFRGYRYRVPY